MTILNIMLGKKRGGLEQAALDYAQALDIAGIACLTVTSADAWLVPQLTAAHVAHESLVCHGNWDILAVRRLRTIAERTKATAIICHGNRAISIALKALKGRIPVIAVAHNYSTRRFARADACFAITPHLQEYLASTGCKNIFIMPNMARLSDALPRGPFRTPPIIGSMGRFVAKKGFKSYIEALSVLRSRGVTFRALLGGEGKESAQLMELIARYQLEDIVTYTGWVQNKSTFFAAIDIFVLPSLEEAFGIVLIEAMSHGIPVVSADAHGPSQIIHEGVDGLLVARNDPEAMADAIESLLANPARAAKLGEEGAKLVADEYTMEAMARRLKTTLAAFT